MNQRLSDWASIAEIVGTVAIVATLLILIFEVRGNTEATHAATLQSLAARSEAITLERAANGELAGIVDKAWEDQELTGVEEARFRAWLIAQMRVLEEAYLQYDAGRLDDDYWEARAAATLNWFGTEAARDAYVVWKRTGTMTSQFEEWFDQALRNSHGNLYGSRLGH